MNGRKSSRGFTLTELLVTIAIIALMCVLLFPAYGSIRTSVLRTQCASNMRQVYTAIATYASDNNDQLVPLVDASPRYGSFNGAANWGNILVLKSYIGVYSEDYHSQNFSLYHCPVVQADMSLPGAVSGIYPLIGTMGMSYFGSSVYDDQGIPATPQNRFLHQLHDPSNRFLLADAAEYVIFNSQPNEEYPIVYRHGGKANVCFMDGHIESLAPASIPEAPAVPGDPHNPRPW